MKNTAKIFGIIVLAAVIGFIASCSGAGAGGGNTEKTGTINTGDQNNTSANEPLVFESIVNGEVLQIIISREPINRSLARSSITPKNGDYYEIIHGNKVISKGIISSVIAADKDGWSEIVFTPSSDSPCGNKESFTGTVNPGDVVDSSGVRNGGKLTIPQLPYEGGVLTGIEADQIDDTESGVVIGAATINLKGQVWTMGESGYYDVHFTGNREITGIYYYDYNDYGEYVEIGGNGSITNGLFNFTIGTPAELTNITTAFSVMEIMDYCYSNFNISNNDALGATLDFLTAGGTLNDGAYEVFGRMHGEILGDTFESIIYIYVDRDVVVTGNGKSFGSGVHTSTTTDLNLNLKAGWNTLYRKEVSGTDYIISSYSLNNPSYIRWIIYTYDNNGFGVGPSLPSVRH